MRLLHREMQKVFRLRVGGGGGAFNDPLDHFFFFFFSRFKIFTLIRTLYTIHDSVNKSLAKSREEALVHSKIYLDIYCLIIKRSIPVLFRNRNGKNGALFLSLDAASCINFADHTVVVCLAIPINALVRFKSRRSGAK